MTDLETIRRLSAQEHPALQLAEQAIRERDRALAFLRRGVTPCDGMARIVWESEVRAFLHQRDR